MHAITTAAAAAVAVAVAVAVAASIAAARSERDRTAVQAHYAFISGTERINLMLFQALPLLRRHMLCDDSTCSSHDQPCSWPPQSPTLLPPRASLTRDIACVRAGVALLCCGYDKEWMHNTMLCLVSLVLCLIGMFFHEFRPFNVSC
jgi:hypothetical protein